MFDPFSEGFAADPYAVYKELRQEGGFHYFERSNIWMLSRYGDIADLATNPAMARVLTGYEDPEEAERRKRAANWHDMPFHERVVQFSLLDSNGEIHRRLRTLLFGKFKTREISPLEPVVHEFVEGLIGELQEDKVFDFVEDFAAHVPGYVIGHLLGVPAEDAPQLRLWSEQIVQYFDLDRSDERKKIAETASREFYHFLADLKAERLKNPRDDLISQMIEDEAKGLYVGDEFISTCMLILMAGHGSTIDVLGSGLHTLLKNPDTLQRLRQGKDLWPAAIEEMFRFEPPLPFFHRHALEEVEIAGRMFPAGTTFGFLYASANRDPDQYEAPEKFNIDRRPNRHLAFGIGEHLCLGNNLARMNMRIIYQSLFKAFSEIELAEAQPEYKRGLSVRGPVALPLRVRR